MLLARALRAKSNSCIALVGAGGKTSALFQLGRELSPAILTNTSHLGEWQTANTENHVIAQSKEDLQKINLQDVALITGEIKEGRAQPVSDEILHELRSLSQEKTIPLIIEADGSRQKPVKAPAEHEPPIPDFADIVVVVAGLSALGKPLSEKHVHRAEIFSTLSKLPINETIDSSAVVNVLTHPQGGLKNIPTNARRVVLLNQAYSPELQSMAQHISPQLLKTYDSVVIASLKNEQVYAANEKCAGIVLAAGEGKRYGDLKQLLDWKGKPFVRQVAETALHAGLEPVLVVTGFRAADVESALKDLPITIIENHEWNNGQSTSIRAGIKALPKEIGSAIFLLADQPQIPAEVMRALLDAHSQELSPIIAPLVLEEKRGNPVLFDRVTFPDLLKLEGDTGGRGIFHKHVIEFIPWHDDRLLLDVDKPEDYQRLITDDTL